MRRLRASRFHLALAVLVGTFAASAGAASAAPDVYTVSTWSPSHLVAGENSRLQVELLNEGDGETSTNPPALAVQIALPPNVASLGKTPVPGASQRWDCVGVTTVKCTATSTLPAFAGYIGSAGPPEQSSMIMLDLKVGVGVTGTFPMTVTTSGGGTAEPNVETRQVTIANEPLGFGIHDLVAGAFDDEGEEYFQAGGHPHDIRADFAVNMEELSIGGGLFPVTPAGGHIRDVVVETPPGFVGDPTAVPKCSERDLARGGISVPGCPDNTQVGTVLLRVPQLGNFEVGVYNVEPPGALPAQFAFHSPVDVVRINPSVRSDGDYGLTTTVSKITQADVLLRSQLILWGNPADPRHDDKRCAGLNLPTRICNGYANNGLVTEGSELMVPHPFEGPEKAFLSIQTNCVEEPVTTFHLDKWQDPAPMDDLSDPRWTSEQVHTPTATGCEEVPFDPTMTLQPETDDADSATGLDVRLRVPREGDSDPEGLVHGHLKKTTVTLPEGLSLSPAAADGLKACTSDEIGLTSAIGAEPIRFDNAAPDCPDAAKIGSGEVITPLLEDPLRGEVFLAAQEDNPFGSTYAIYIVVREPSIQVKLAGEVKIDRDDGQIATVFDHNPQLPFSELRLNLYGGDRANLATPATCGRYTTRVAMTPWSAKDPEAPTGAETAQSPDSFAIDEGARGEDCADEPEDLPFAPGLAAGSANPIAGAHSPFSIRITRPDGHQELERLQISPPPGLVASLRGIPYCSEAQIAAAKRRDSGRAERSSPSCPAASRIGATNAGAGPGPRPFYAPGRLYLAGPYKDAPLSVVAITPAVAGPFDLGNVVIRSALRVDPKTARITAITDRIPRILEGVPLRIRDIRVVLDRPAWAQNPTSCEALAVNVTAFGAAGALARPANRFQVGNCAALGFEPTTKLRLFGGVKRGSYQGVRAVVRPRPGDANVSRAVVRFPKSAFIAQEHIRTVCTRVQFAAEACPAGAIYGKAVAWSPVLDDPLTGHVYLRSSDNTLPDAVADLRGPAHQPIKVEVAIRNDSVGGALRNTVLAAPDAPVSHFRLQMFGGEKGLIVNSRNICRGKNLAAVGMRAHNGRRSTERVAVANRRCKKLRRAWSKRRKAAKRRSAARERR